MAEIRKGASWTSLAALLIGIGLIAFLAWSATHKTDSELYTKGAQHNEASTTIAPVQHNYPLSIPGCGRFLTIQTPDGIKYTDQDRKKAVK
jgi:hypothetical protein